MNHAFVARIAAVLPALLALIVGLGSSLLTPHVVYGASGKIFAVNSTLDRVDSKPGDGQCKTAAGTCTLRAAIMEANASSGSSVIRLPAPATYQLTIAGNSGAQNGDLDISRSMTILAIGGTATIIGSAGWGDRIFHIFSGATVELRDIAIAGGNPPSTNVGGRGGAILIEPGGVLTLLRCNVQNNVARSGGGISNDGTLVLDRTTVRNNTSCCGGGGIRNGGTLTLVQNSSITGNTTDGDGGGLWTETSSQTTLTDCTIANNTATGFNGGGIANEGTLAVNRCTVSGNSALSIGGGIENIANAVLTMTNSTVSGNTAEFGGGIENENQGQATLNNVTIAGNTASVRGGGIENLPSGAPVTILRNTILGGNSAPTGPDCFADATRAIRPEAFNLVQSLNDCSTISGTGNITGQDPRLGPLQQNGGPTTTRALCTGVGVPDASCSAASAAIGTGSPATPGSGGNACAATDQRSVSRPQGARCDIGAFESAPVGAFELVPNDAVAEAGKRVFYEFRWTHTTQWRELETLQLRFVSEDDGEVILWVRWTQEGDTFSVFNEHEGTFGRELPPGAHHELKTKLAELDLVETAVVTSGPAGHDATLILALRFKTTAAGHDHRHYRIEVSATDDFGNEQGFDTAGTLQVVRRAE